MTTIFRLEEERIPAIDHVVDAGLSRVTCRAHRFSTGRGVFLTGPGRFRLQPVGLMQYAFPSGVSFFIPENAKSYRPADHAEKSRTILRNTRLYPCSGRQPGLEDGCYCQTMCNMPRFRQGDCRGAYRIARELSRCSQDIV